MTGENGPESRLACDASRPSILVVGGGCAGWMTAAAISQSVDDAGCRITVIEPTAFDSPSTGEATLPAVGGFLDFLGLVENEWMQACRATFSLGTRFENWLSASEEDHFWQVFGSAPLDGGGRVSPMQLWVRDCLAGEQIPDFARAMHPGVAVAAAGKVPRNAYDAASAQLPYGFHLDEALLAALLRKKAMSRGVARRSDLIERIEAEGERITGVRLQDGEKLVADLYVDCTGDRGLLIGEALSEPWLDWSAFLPCNRSVVIQGEYAAGDSYNEMNGGLAPYTTKTAVEAGWIWRFHLVGGFSAGYAHSSAHLDPGAAEERLRDMLGARATEAVARHMGKRPGRRRRSWVGNCVAVGSAAAVVEPQTPAHLVLVQSAIFQLLQNFPDVSMPADVRARFNRNTAAQIDGVRDVLVLPYVLTDRVDTPFWRSLRKEASVPDTLAPRLREWRRVWPTEPAGPAIFGRLDICSILAGMGVLPQRPLPAAEWTPNRDAHRVRIEETARRLVSELPTHAEFFRQQERIAAFRADDSW